MKYLITLLFAVILLFQLSFAQGICNENGNVILFSNYDGGTLNINIDENVPNIQSSWVTQGLKIGQLALLFGANDMGSLMIEENVVAEAGTVHFLTLDEIRAAIEELGYVPRQRDVFYRLLESEREAQAIAANRQRLVALK